MERFDPITLDNLGGGAAREMFEMELARALADLDDPNTNPKKAREVVLRVKIHPADSQIKRVEIFCDAKLGSNNAFETHFLMGRDPAGRPVATEYLPKQAKLPFGETSQAEGVNTVNLEERRGHKS